jgi:hypothetical protein
MGEMALAKTQPVEDRAGPAGDYPMVLGAPFMVDGVTYTPADTMNYDAVGYAGEDGGEGISGAHHTLPLPSYVEVTALDRARPSSSGLNGAGRCRAKCCWTSRPPRGRNWGWRRDRRRRCASAASIRSSRNAPCCGRANRPRRAWIRRRACSPRCAANWAPRPG